MTSTPFARTLVAVCVVAVAIGLFGGAAAAADAPADGRLLVELDDEGGADAVFVDAYNLTVDGQRAAFEDIRRNDERRAAAAAELRSGLQSVSEEASAGIDRELRIGEVTVETRVSGDAGIVAYRFRWENLTRVDGGRVVLTEPFATFDALDRELVVVAPAGYELTEVSPPPERRIENTVGWPGLTSFGDGFVVVATAAEEPTPEFAEGDDTYGGPIALGVSALLFAALFIGRKR